ncbi:MAG: zinc-ribbon domain-containing protein [Anaerolineae bacterium]|nr:zinc-ribbon domain-containing protein [Anaerolineae bacterium]
MECSNCGSENPEDSRFCQMCGASFTRPTRDRYLSKGGRAWWYPIGLWAILSAFFLFVELMAWGGINWSLWPVGILGILLVGFTLLRYANDRYARQS